MMLLIRISYINQLEEDLEARLETTVETQPKNVDDPRCFVSGADCRSLVVSNLVLHFYSTALKIYRNVPVFFSCRCQCGLFADSQIDPTGGIEGGSLPLWAEAIDVTDVRMCTALVQMCTYISQS